MKSLLGLGIVAVVVTVWHGIIGRRRSKQNRSLEVPEVCTENYNDSTNDSELTRHELEEIQMEVRRALRNVASRSQRRRRRHITEDFYGDNFPEGPELEYQDHDFDEDLLDELREVLMDAPFMRNPYEGREVAGELPDHYFLENREPYYQAELENVRTWRVVEGPIADEEDEETWGVKRANYEGEDVVNQEEDAGICLLYQLALEMEEELENEGQGQQGDTLVG